ncbi:trehalose-phosphatase [Ordospora pajunii]|uniref:trehalose-phosphatase n=1 Tax=Ordospora pajunii TaxID=3039483 RepID=UPI00295289B1|nr:trehalose-phosphatase [Ordospora pajunii]KAH9412179.1 trehalose-phosphatase [Ordospora pajunii]
MKVIIVSDELPIFASHTDADIAIKQSMSEILKNIPHRDKSSKIQIEFSEVSADSIRMFAKPHFMSVDMLDDHDLWFVGRLGLSNHRCFTEDELSVIGNAMKRYKCYPVFEDQAYYSDLIRRTLEGHTYDLVQKSLDHALLFDQYVDYNSKCCEKVMEIYEEGDVVWIQDIGLLLLPEMMKDVPVGISFANPFSSLFRCIPFWERLLLSMLCSKYIEFNNKESKACFDLLVSQKAGFVAGNPEYKDLSLPLVRVGRRGLDKDAVLECLPTVSDGECQSNKREKMIVVPSDSQAHLLGIESYLSCHKEEVTVVFLSIRPVKLDGLTEVMRLGQYLEVNYNVTRRVFVPTSDLELLSLLKACDVCYCPEVADLCLFLGVPVIQSNVYDFMQVAREIREKINGETDEERRDLHMCNDIPSKMEWKEHFIRNLLYASGINYVIDLNPKDLKVRRSLEMVQQADIPVGKSCSRNRGEMQHATSINPDDDDDSVIIKMINDFKSSRTKTLVLDYDGTITDIVAYPPMAAPTQEIKELLVNLSKVCRVVISTGRSTEDSDLFFPKELEVFAEHGACHRVDGQWRQRVSFPQKELAFKIAQFFLQRTPGSELESKKTGYAFHYRNVSPLIGVKQAKALFSLLKQAFGDCVKEGNHIVEIRNGKKSFAMETVEDGFILCVGDDVADEEMFEVCKGYTVKVGKDKDDLQTLSAAYEITNPKSFRKLLQRFLE